MFRIEILVDADKSISCDANPCDGPVKVTAMSKYETRGYCTECARKHPDAQIREIADAELEVN